MTHNVLFVCSRNRLRSPTAEQVFADWPGVATASAGVNRDADNPLSAELIEWAEMIFVMERVHRGKLAAKFRPILGAKRVICLDIRDDYDYMAPELVELLRARVPKYLRPMPENRRKPT
jgi:predicted protein tyrosine phosphatase